MSPGDVYDGGMNHSTESDDQIAAALLVAAASDSDPDPDPDPALGDTLAAIRRTYVSPPGAIVPDLAAMIGLNNSAPIVAPDRRRRIRGVATTPARGTASCRDAPATTVASVPPTAVPGPTTFTLPTIASEPIPKAEGNGNADSNGNTNGNGSPGGNSRAVRGKNTPAGGPGDRAPRYRTRGVGREHERSGTRDFHTRNRAPAVSVITSGWPEALVFGGDLSHFDSAS